MEEQRKTTKQEVMDKIAQTLKEELVVILENDGKSITLKLLNGQTFRICIEEIE